MFSTNDDPTSGEKITSDSPPGAASRRPRILLAEDDVDILQIGAAVLRASGYWVETASDGGRAWDILEKNKYDLLVTDNSMPRMSGIDLLKRLRAAGSLMPVIMASGTLPKHEFARNPGLQPARTLLKPYTAEELLEAVREVLRTNASQPLDKELPPAS